MAVHYPGIVPKFSKHFWHVVLNLTEVAAIAIVLVSQYDVFCNVMCSFANLKF